MGNCLSRGEQGGANQFDPAGKEGRDKSNAIDRQIESDSRQYRKECKILLLGKNPLAAAAASLAGCGHPRAICC